MRVAVASYKHLFVSFSVANVLWRGQWLPFWICPVIFAIIGAAPEHELLSYFIYFSQTPSFVLGQAWRASCHVYLKISVKWWRSQGRWSLLPMQRVLRGNNWRHFDVVDSYGISTTSLQRLILPLLLSWLNILDLSARQEIECLSPGCQHRFLRCGVRVVEFTSPRSFNSRHFEVN